jgi:hypothetical protein
MPTSKVTEIGHNWPDIFITGNIPADASDDLLGACALSEFRPHGRDSFHL